MNSTTSSIPLQTPCDVVAASRLLSDMSTLSHESQSSLTHSLSHSSSPPPPSSEQHPVDQRKRSTRSWDLMEHMEGKDILDGRYKMIKQLQSGGFGVIYCALDKTKKNSKYVAIKVQKRGCYESSACSKIIANEVNTLKKVTGHPNVIEYIDYRTTASYAFLVTEYYTSPALVDIIGDEGVEEQYAKDIIFEIFDGLSYLHSKGVYHCDLKPENVIVDYHVRIIDFGLASNKPTQKGTFGTDEYMAPEMWGSEPWLCEKGDVWSMGITIIEVLTGRQPWGVAKEEDSAYRLYRAVRDEDVDCLRACLVHSLPQKLAGSMHYVLNPRPNERPGLSAMVIRVKQDWT